MRIHIHQEGSSAEPDRQSRVCCLQLPSEPSRRRPADEAGKGSSNTTPIRALWPLAVRHARRSCGIHTLVDSGPSGSRRHLVVRCAMAAVAAAGTAGTAVVRQLNRLSTVKCQCVFLDPRIWEDVRASVNSSNQSNIMAFKRYVTGLSERARTFRRRCVCGAS